MNYEYIINYYRNCKNYGDCYYVVSYWVMWVLVFIVFILCYLFQWIFRVRFRKEEYNFVVVVCVFNNVFYCVLNVKLSLQNLMFKKKSKFRLVKL